MTNLCAMVYKNAAPATIAIERRAALMQKAASEFPLSTTL